MPSKIYAPVFSRASTWDNDVFGDAYQSGMSDDALPWLSAGKDSLATSETAVLLGKGVIAALVRGPYFKWQTVGVIGMSLGEQFFPMHVDMACFEPEAMQQTLVEDQEQAQLATRLWASFDIDSLEDGMFHPSEQIIADALCSMEEQQVLNWLMALSLDAGHPSFSASVLKCLGRQPNPGTNSWRARLVREGLAMDDVEIRDAAAQAAELWGDLELVEVLESHSEPESWLQDYIRDIIGDLRE